MGYLYHGYVSHNQMVTMYRSYLNWRENTSTLKKGLGISQASEHRWQPMTLAGSPRPWSSPFAAPHWRCRQRPSDLRGLPTSGGLKKWGYHHVYPSFSHMVFCGLSVIKMSQDEFLAVDIMILSNIYWLWLTYIGSLASKYLGCHPQGWVATPSKCSIQTFRCFVSLISRKARTGWRWPTCQGAKKELLKVYQNGALKSVIPHVEPWFFNTRSYKSWSRSSDLDDLGYPAWLRKPPYQHRLPLAQLPLFQNPPTKLSLGFPRKPKSLTSGSADHPPSCSQRSHVHEVHRDRPRLKPSRSKSLC